MLRKTMKLVSVLIVLGFVLNQGALYNSVVLAGNYIGNASIGNVVVVVLVWPITVLTIAFMAIRSIIKFSIH